MTKLLEQAIEQLRQLPESFQDAAARALLSQLEEEPEADDIAAIAQGRGEIAHGHFVSLEEWRHDMGRSDR